MLWISLFLFLLYILIQTLWGLTVYQRIVDAILADRLKRSELFKRLMAGLWIPIFAVLLLIVFNQFSFNDIGLGWRQFNIPPWLRIVSFSLTGLYFIYLTLSLIGLKQNVKRGINSNQKIPDRIKALYPVSRKDKRIWAIAAVNAGVCEEILFRGFVIYLLGMLFPALPLLVNLVLSSIIFGIGHLYQGWREALKPALLGLLFGLIYVSFGTLLPCIVLHAMQDWCALYVVNGETTVYHS